MSELSFTIHSREKNSAARCGEIHTPHGKIRTPAFVPVGTAGTVKSLTPEEITASNIDVFFVNTYHMVFRPGIDTVEELGGLHTFMNWKGPVMTDSGGFQAFSLGDAGPKQTKKPDQKKLVRMTQNGIFFSSPWDGKKVFLGPSESITAQVRLGSDIMMAFDECTFYPIEKSRAELAMERTHRWLGSCINEKKKWKTDQALYGVVQGSVFQDLRKTSAKYIASLPLNGYAIGSVANSNEPREKVFSVIDWVLPILPADKPIHFLGIGEVEDILRSVEKGIDTLDCVTPTRMGRMGWIFSKKAGRKNKFRYDITKASYALDKKPPDETCQCATCANFSRAYLHHLFRSRELLAYRLATVHNLYFFGTLMENIRMAIAENKFMRLKALWLSGTSSI